MASIPLPALDAGRNQQPSPLQQYAQLMGVRQMQQQQQTGQLQQTNLAQQNQMQALQLKDQMTLRQLAPQYLQKDSDGNVTGYDFKGLFGAAGAAGVSPQTLQKMQMDQLDLTQKYAATDSATRANELSKNKAAYDVLEGVRSETDPAARQNAYQQGVQQLQKLGVDTSKFPPQAPADEVLNQFEAGLGVHAQVLADAETKAKTASEQVGQWKQVEGTGMFWNPATSETKTPAGEVLTPSMMQSKFVTLQSQKALGQPISKEDQAFLTGFAKFKEMVPAFNFNLQSQGVSNQPLNPSQQATAQAILEGRMTPPSSFALRTPYWQTVMGAVFQQDPQFSEQRAELRKGYTVGAQSKEINAINTGMAHVGVLGDAIDALNNGDVKVLNALANQLGVQTGQTPVTTFKTIVNRVGPEISKAYLGAGGSAEERGGNEKDFDPSLSPQQLKSNVAITAQLLRSKIGALQNQWDQNKSDSMPSFEDRFIMPQAKQQLDKWAPQGGGGGAQQTGGGKTITKANVAQAAKDHGVSVEEATKQAQAAGYTIQ